MPQSIPKGLTREDVLRALADLDAGVEHPFGPPTGYELVHEGRRYPPKAVDRAGLPLAAGPHPAARGVQRRRGPRPGELRAAGARASRSRRRHRRHPGSTSRKPRSGAGTGPADEVDLIVADYFAMLQAELAGAAVQQGRAQPRPSAAPGRPLEGLGRVQAPEHQRRPGRAWGCRTSTATSPPGTTRRRSCPRPSRTT